MNNQATSNKQQATSKFYITNAIPYVNDAPHIGHTLEFMQSDAIARYHRQLGEDVLYLCGTDENALKNVQSAEKQGLPIQQFVDKYAKVFADVAKALHISFDIFQKTSDKKHHYAASQLLWQKCAAAGDIYKKLYKGLYCVGCEEFKTKDDLNENGECPEHPGKKLEEVEEENYFFRLSKYQEQLIKLIESDAYEIVPRFRKNEILSFLKSGLEDFSISRSNTRAKNWGIPVPGDDTQRIYVWFDALNVYQSGIGLGWDETHYEKWWPADVHVVGKGIIRFHAVYWPAMLLSAGFKLPKKLFVHEYFTVNGQKMSKTLGNVINPLDLIGKYGAEALRYYCLAKFSPFSDGDFSEEKFKEAYTADLSNGLGNLVSRVAKLCENAGFSVPKDTTHVIEKDEYTKALEEFRFNDALSFVWKKISGLDKYINDERPWELAKKDDQKLQRVLSHAVDEIQEIAILLTPFLPVTAEKISVQFTGEIKSSNPLFPRLKTT